MTNYTQTGIPGSERTRAPRLIIRVPLNEVPSLHIYEETALTVLDGTGTVNGTATVNNVAGSAIQGGTGSGNAGTLNTGNLSFGGSTAKLVVNSTGAAASRVNVTGTVALGGCTVDLMNAMSVGTYDLIVASGTMSGTLPTIGTNNSGRTAALSQVGNTLRLTLT